MIITHHHLNQIATALAKLSCAARVESMPVQGRDLLAISGSVQDLQQALPVLGRYLPPADLIEMAQQTTESIIFLHIEVQEGFAFTAEN